MYALGIDLGTTNSVVAVFKKGQKETIRIDGRPTLPSVVSFRPDQPPLVGQSAKNRLLVDPESTVASAKRQMGNPHHAYQIGRSSYSPVDIGSLVLKKIMEASRSALGQDVWDAVITVPAYFNDAQRAATKLAGEQAGLNVLRLLPEPTAAAISYGLNRNRDQTILVYDLGGGTFDVSILRVKGNDFRVLGVGGDAMLGGDDFDDLIVHWAAGKFREKYATDILGGSGRDFAQARQRLKESAEKAKKELSDADTTEIMLPDVLGKPLELELHLSTFEALARPLLDKTINSTRQVLKDTKLSVDDIDRVILVGGSTRMRMVKKMVAKEIKEPFGDESPDEAVAWGAAVVAASLSTPDEDLAPAISVQDATAHSLGVGMMDEKNQYSFFPLIPRNTNYPCSGGMMGCTMVPMQSEVVLSVYRGEDKNPERNHALGKLNLEIKDRNSNPVPVVALFRLDDNGILDFQAVDFPGKAMKKSEVADLLDYAMRNNGSVDVSKLESLVRERTLPEPSKVTIDPWSN